MAIFGQFDLASATNTLVATAPAQGATVNVLLCNRTTNTIAVSVGIVPFGGSLTVVSWIEYQTPVDGNQILERGGIPLASGDMVYVNPTATGMSCSVVGALGS